MDRSTFIARVVNFLSVIVIVASLGAISSGAVSMGSISAPYDIQCIAVPGGPGGGGFQCDQVIVNGVPCCPCDMFGNPTGNCDPPVDPPTPDPPTIPDPTPPVCEDDRPGDKCPGRGGAVAGTSCYCEDVDVMKALMDIYRARNGRIDILTVFHGARLLDSSLF